MLGLIGITAKLCLVCLTSHGHREPTILKPSQLFNEGLGVAAPITLLAKLRTAVSRSGLCHWHLRHRIKRLLRKFHLLLDLWHLRRRASCIINRVNIGAPVILGMLRGISGKGFWLYFVGYDVALLDSSEIKGMLRSTGHSVRIFNNKIEIWHGSFHCHATSTIIHKCRISPRWLIFRRFLDDLGA